MVKCCNKCSEEKDISEFSRRSSAIDGHVSQCKSCIAQREKEYALANPEKVKARKKRQYEIHKDVILKNIKTKYHLNRTEIRKKADAFIMANRQRLRNEKSIRHKKRMSSDVNYRLGCAIRVRLSNHLKEKNAGKVFSFQQYIGCSPIQLKEYIESKFKDGMTWKNHGIKGWHIDHIIPLSSFDLTKEDQFKKACHFTNLQPLWWFDNIKKSNKLLA